MPTPCPWPFSNRLLLGTSSPAAIENIHKKRKPVISNRISPRFDGFKTWHFLPLSHFITYLWSFLLPPLSLSRKTRSNAQLGWSGGRNWRKKNSMKRRVLLRQVRSLTENTLLPLSIYQTWQKSQASDRIKKIPANPWNVPPSSIDQIPLRIEASVAAPTSHHDSGSTSTISPVELTTLTGTATDPESNISQWKI